MRKCVWTTTALAVFALSGLYLAAQHAARHPESNLGCFVRGLVAWVPGCGSETQPVSNSPVTTRTECCPERTPCPGEVNEPIVVEKSPDVRTIDGWLDHDWGQQGGTVTLGGVISPTGGAEESDEPPPFMPLCPEDEPDGVRRMPYAEDGDDVELDSDIDLSLPATRPVDTDTEGSEESEPDLPRGRTDPHHYDPHYPSCPYTGGRCPVPTYRIVRPTPATTPTGPATTAPKN